LMTRRDAVAACSRLVRVLAVVTTIKVADGPGAKAHLYCLETPGCLTVAKR
jgi:hypothetical protein